MLAAEAHPEVVELLAERFERCVTWTNKRGVDAVRVALHHLLRTYFFLLMYLPTYSSITTKRIILTRFLGPYLL